jgi:hypothetical protein
VRPISATDGGSSCFELPRLSLLAGPAFFAFIDVKGLREEEREDIMYGQRKSPCWGENDDKNCLFDRLIIVAVRNKKTTVYKR